MMKHRRVVLFTAAMGCCLAAGENRAGEPKPFDLQGYIDRAVQSGDRRIVVPPGTYRVLPSHRQHLVLSELHDTEIIADGVEMICTQTTRAVTLSGCRNVSIRGLKIDHDPLPFSQGRITAVSADRTSHDIELLDGYPGSKAVVAFKYEIFRPDTRTLRCADYDYMVQKLDARHIRVRKSHASASDPEQVGDLIVIGAEDAPAGSIPHAVFAEHCSGLRLEDIDLYASNCFGFLEEDCDGSVYVRCRIDRRAAATDIAHRAEPRIRSLNADAFHSKGAARGPAYIGCTARFMGDDAVNIHGNYHMITEARRNVLRVLANGKVPQAGEGVELLSYEGRRLPDACVQRVEPAGKITADERAFLSRQKMDQGLRTRWTPNAFMLTLDRDVDLPRGSLLSSTRRMGNGFVVKGCDFGFNRSRGILIKASDGAVVGNTLTANWMAAVLVAPEYWWLESGSSCHVTIRGNTIRDCRETAIRVVARGGPGELAPAGAHRDISILGNTLSAGPWPAIEITSTRGGLVAGNAITPAPVRALTWSASSPNPASDPPEPVRSTHCEGVSVRDNSVAR